MSDAAAPTHDGFGPVTYEPLSRVRQVGAARLHAAWNQIPHVTHFEEADVTAADRERRAMNAATPSRRLTLLAWIASACVLALREHPRFCAAFDAEQCRLVLKRYVNLGIAIDTPAGLVVGVVPAADRLALEDLGVALAELAARGRAGRLRPAEMEGSCFTISSLGKLGGTGFTPIINAPDVAILGVSPARERPVWVDGRVEPRLLMPLSLSYDHRAINGVEAARFCATLAQSLARPRP